MLCLISVFLLFHSHRCYEKRFGILSSPWGALEGICLRLDVVMDVLLVDGAFSVLIETLQFVLRRGFAEFDVMCGTML